MITPSLPQDRATLVDKDFRVTLPYRRWMNDVTKRLAEPGTASGPIIAGDPVALTIGGTGWIVVTGSVESGHFTITQRPSLTTDNLTEGSESLYFTDARADARVTAWAAAPILDPLPPDAVNDAAAATAGVPVKGIYRNGSILMVRVA